MLFQTLSHNPAVIGAILRGTPTWVWGLLAALITLGLSQIGTRRVSLTRLALTPVAMTGFAVYGLISAFGHTGTLPVALAAWTAAAAGVLMVFAGGAAPQGARFDPASRTVVRPGSVVPLLLILCVFTIKYAVGVELAMSPAQARDTAFVLPVAAFYGAVSGGFQARAWRLLRLALRPSAPTGQPSLA